MFVADNTLILLILVTEKRRKKAYMETRCVEEGRKGRASKVNVWERRPGCLAELHQARTISDIEVHTFT